MSNLLTKPWQSSTYLLPKSVQTLLTPPEIQLLHWLAENFYTGEGAIIDAGPFLGGSTVALLDGLCSNSRFSSGGIPVLHAYDLFRVTDSFNIWGHLGNELGKGSSFLGQFKSNLGDRETLVEIHEGDILQESWSGGPIEILFIDIAKTPEILEHVAKTFYPHLIPGKSIVIHQDLQYPGCPWIHMSMHALKEFFTPLDYLPNNTAVFRFEKAIPLSSINQCNYRAFSPAARLELHKMAITSLPINGRLMLELNEVIWLLEAGKQSDATNRLLEIYEQTYGDLTAYSQVISSGLLLFPELHAPTVSIDIPESLTSDARLALVSQMTPTERMVLFTLVRSLRPDRMLEVGRARGGSTYVIAEALKDCPETKFVSMDPNNWPEHSISPVLRDNLTRRVHFIDGYCPYEVPKAVEFSGGNFDFVFLDGDHSYSAVKRDLIGLLPYVNTGGYILMHDAHFAPLRKAVDEVIAESSLMDCGNLVSESSKSLSHILVDGKPSIYGGMYLLRKQPTVPNSTSASVHTKAMAKLESKIRQLKKELDRANSRGFFKKLTRSINKRLGKT